MSLRLNDERLVELGIAAQVTHPRATGSYSVDDYGHPIMLPGMSGVVGNARVGDLVFSWAADHLEPGVSAGCPDRGNHQALQFLACVGNEVRVLDGPAAGQVGTVTGKHAFVLIDFSLEALELLAPGDRLLVRSLGQGLQLLDHPEVATRSCSPALARALLSDAGGKLQVPVAGEIPAYLMGAGLGMSSEWANCDVMLTSRETIERHGFEGLRMGDVVVMTDQDHRFGRGYRKGFSAIGVVAHGGHAGVPGHGMGVATVLSGPSDQIETVRSDRANLVELLGLREREAV
jgi:hypothetical protein